MAGRKIVQAKTSFTTMLDGRRVSVAAGDPYYSDDPIVKGRERHFGELTVKSTAKEPAAARTSETATAAPGERRRMARPAEPKADDKAKEGKADA